MSRHHDSNPYFGSLLGHWLVDGTPVAAQGFFDDFNDGNYTGWTAGESWGAANGYAENGYPNQSAISSNNYLSQNKAHGDGEFGFSYRWHAASTAGARMDFNFRLKSSPTSYLRIVFFAGYALLQKIPPNLGAVTLQTDYDADTYEGQWYDVRVVMDGPDIEVWRTERGTPNWTPILAGSIGSDNALLDGAQFSFTVVSNATEKTYAQIDNFQYTP